MLYYLADRFKRLRKDTSCLSTKEVNRYFTSVFRDVRTPPNHLYPAHALTGFISMPSQEGSSLSIVMLKQSQPVSTAMHGF